MNKKFLIFGILGILAIAVVSAVSYYALFSTSFNVVSAITTSNCDDVLEGEYFDDDIVSGSACTITNNAPTERTISISNDAGDDIEVSYWSNLELTTKEVNFSADIWNVSEDKVDVNYVVVGDEFTATVEKPIDDYVLVYYKDNDERFDNPANVIGIESISDNLPYEDDENKIIDYSAEYSTTPHGAKIWYVPSDAVEGNVVDWNRADEFYFESKLIQYNSGGNLILYGDSSLVITPIYTIGKYANGTYEITTTIA